MWIMGSSPDPSHFTPQLEETNNREDAIGAELVVFTDKFAEFDDLDLPDMETALAGCSPAKDGRDAD